MTKKEHIKQLLKKTPGITNYELRKLSGASSAYVRKHAGTNASRGIEDRGGKRSAEVKDSVEGPGCTTNFGSDTGTIVYRVNRHIKDIPTAVKEQNIDLLVWEITNVKTVENKWDVTMKLGPQSDSHPHRATNYQFKITISLRRRKDAAPILGIESLIKRIPKIKIPKIKAQKHSGVAMAVAPLDAHMGKFAWARETGRRDYGIKQCKDDYLDGINTTLGWGKYFKPEHIYYIVGQDLMHTENFASETPMGRNHLDVDNRLPKIFEYAMDTVITSIGMCASIAPTTVLWVPGNHDMHASLFLCMALKRIFKGESRITVDDSPMQRKRIIWGNLLVGITHGIVGRQQSWANELAQAWPKEWGESRFREWWFGHKHKKAEVRTFPILTMGGVVMRQLTALSPIDAWHFENLYTDAVPGSEALMMDKKRGVFANFTAWTDVAPVLGGV